MSDAKILEILNKINNKEDTAHFVVKYELEQSTGVFMRGSIIPLNPQRVFIEWNGVNKKDFSISTDCLVEGINQASYLFDRMTKEKDHE